MYELIEDIILHKGKGFTVIPDGHKGLIEVVSDVLPEAEHKQCARHIYGNLKKNWSCLSLKNLLWGAVATTFVFVFEQKMELIINLNTTAHTWLVERDPDSWYMAFFGKDKACQAFENEICESYHSTIVDARGKPILTMLEDITPSLRKQIETLKKFQRHML